MTEAPGQLGLLTHAEYLFKLGWPFVVKHPLSWGIPDATTLWRLAVLYREDDITYDVAPDDIEVYFLSMEDELGVSLPRDVS